MPDCRALLTLPEVALTLRKTATWFRRRWKHLVEAEGFPAPQPGLGLVWDPAAVEAWFDRNRPAHLRLEPTITLEGDAGARLDAAAAALAKTLAEKARPPRHNRRLTSH